LARNLGLSDKHGLRLAVGTVSGWEKELNPAFGVPSWVIYETIPAAIRQE